MTYKEALEEQKRMIKFRAKHYYGSTCTSPGAQEEKSTECSNKTYHCNAQ